MKYIDRPLATTSDDALAFIKMITDALNTMMVLHGLLP
jgi:hypothetical protein